MKSGHPLPEGAPCIYSDGAPLESDHFHRAWSMGRSSLWFGGGGHLPSQLKIILIQAQIITDYWLWEGWCGAPTYFRLKSFHATIVMAQIDRFIFKSKNCSGWPPKWPNSTVFPKVVRVGHRLSVLRDRVQKEEKTGFRCEPQFTCDWNCAV